MSDADTAPPLVHLDEVDIRLWGKTLLAGVSFQLREREHWALLGPNGSGKSTLLRLLRGELAPHPGSPGRRLFALDGRAEESSIGARERIALVSGELQDAYVRHAWDLTAEQVIRSGFTDSVWPEEATGAQRARIDEVTGWLGVAPLLRRSILELSSGEARKVLLARALVTGPRILLLDEVANGLDAAARTSLLALVSRIARTGVPVVMATHRDDEVVPEVTHVARMERGRIVERRPAAGPLTPTLSHGERENSVSHGDSHPLSLRERARVRGDHPEPEPLLSLSRATVLVAGRPILKDVTWSVRRGESWAVLGPNGSGKSTLLRVVHGDQHLAPGGTIVRLGFPESAGIWAPRARMGLVSQHLQANHLMDLRAEDVVRSGFFSTVGLSDDPTEEQRAVAASAMSRLGVGHLARRWIHSLSYGELRRILLSRALVTGPELLLLDEPCNGLDPAARDDVLALLADLCAAGTSLVMTTHHDAEVIPCLTHVAELRGGIMVSQGPR